MRNVFTPRSRVTAQKVMSHAKCVYAAFSLRREWLRLFWLVLLPSKCVVIGSCVLPRIPDDIRLCDRRYDPFRLPRSRWATKGDAKINGYRYLFAQLLWVESFHWLTRWSGNRRFGHYVKDRMIAIFLIGPSSRVTAQKDHESWGMCLRHVLE